MTNCQRSVVRIVLLCLWPTLIPGILAAQPPQDNGEGVDCVRISRTESPIEIDGRLDESAWGQRAPARQFWQTFPADSIQNVVQTEIYFLFDDKFLYIGARCYSTGNDYVIPSLRRDYRAGGNDNLTIVLDTYSDGINAQVFGINPYGVMREALVFNGGEDFDESWDNKWTGEASMQEGYWEAEMAIPYSTLRFPKDADEWRFNAYRFDMQTNTRSTWQPIPTNQSIVNLAYTGLLSWEEIPKASGGKVSLIPYAAANFIEDFEEGDPGAFSWNVGGDAKVAITPGLNLDLTVNPDFSQVEVDRQVINLSRFEIRFPERRQFFLENADLFGGFGFGNSNPFFSRRIGIGQDSADNTIQIPIYGGLRLSGKVGKDWRLGLLNMQTAPEGTTGLPSYNYAVAALQRRVGQRSNVGFIFANKQAFNYRPDQNDEEEEEEQEIFSRFSRVMGLDYNLNTVDNKWTGKTYIQMSINEVDTGSNLSHGAFLEYRVRRFSASWEHQYIGDDFRSETGFIPRNDFVRINPEARLFFYPQTGFISQHGPGIRHSMLWRPGKRLGDRETSIFWDADFRNGGGAFVSIENTFTYLFESFDPTRSDEAVELPGNSGYTYTNLFLSYRTPPQHTLAVEIRANLGQFFNGQRYGGNLEFTYRYQPWGFITLDARYDYIQLPKPYATAGLFLIGPRIDLTFSRSVFFTTFIQYNSQAENVNINARFQWRYAPVSDFFLVYTDNYTPGFQVKNRAIVAKLTYWLNL